MDGGVNDLDTQQVYLVMSILELSDLLSIPCPDGMELGYKYICGAYTTQALAEAQRRALEAATGGLNLTIVPQALIGEE